MVFRQFHYTKRDRFMPFLLAEILNFQGSTHRIGVGSFSQVFNGRLDPEELPLLEHAYYEECKIYLEDPAHASSESWAAYQSRITACKALFNGNLDPVDSAFWGETDTMEEKWEELEALEKEVFLKIILGEQPLEYFDQFVEEWKQQGGETITNEINQYIQNDKAVSILMKN